MLKHHKYQKERGITLIVLVVTIVVILILAGITIDVAFQDNGIIKTAQGLQNTINASVSREAQQLEELANAITDGNLIGGGGLTPGDNTTEEPPAEAKPSSPTITVSGTKGEDGYYASDVQITFSKSDNLQTMTYKIDGVTQEITVQDGDSITISDDGTYKILAYMYNNQNVASTAANVQFVKDTVAPTATLQVTETLTDTITVQIVANDATSGMASTNPYTFYYKAEGDPNWTTAGTGSASSYTYTGLQAGTTYTLKAEVTDRAGNVGTSNEVTGIQTESSLEIEETTEWDTFHIINGQASSFTMRTTVPVRIADSTKVVLEPNTTGSMVQVEIVNPDANGYGNQIKIIITAGDGNGEEKVVIQEGAIEDATGKALEETEKTGITVDNIKPGMNNVTLPEDTTITKGETSESITITTSEEVTIDTSKFIPVDENGNAIQVPIRVEQQKDGTIHITITGGTEEGNVHIQVQEGALTDTAGNTNEQTTIDTGVTIDSTKPSMEITSPTEGSTIKKDETLEMTITPSEDVTIDTSKVTISGDGSEGSTVNVTKNADGTITITITGGTGTGDIQITIEEAFITDTAGNTNTEQTLPTYQIDNTAPTINSYQITGTATDSITVTVQAEDVGTAGLKAEETYTYYISTDQTFLEGDNTIIITTTDPTYTFTGLEDETTYYTKVEVTDAKDNTATSNVISETTGTIPEGQGIITFTDLTWENGQATTTMSKPDTLTNYTLQYQVVDAEGKTITDWTPVTGDSQEVTGLLHGYTVNARLADTSGNTGNHTTLSVMDNTAPTIILEEQETEDKINARILVTIIEAETGVQVQKYAQGEKKEEYFTTAGTAFTGSSFEANANGIWTVYAEDAAGNATVQTITVTKKDDVAPTMTISPASGIVVKTRNVTVTLTENGSGLADTNSYTYFVSSDANNPTATGYQTGNYTSGTPFSIGTDLTGTYYLFLPVVTDKAGNTSTATITGYYRCGTYVFDNSGPTVSNVVLSNATTTGFKVAITASDNGSAGIQEYTIYYRAGSTGNYSSITTTSNTYTFTNLTKGTTYSVYVTATDSVNNISGNSTVKNLSTLYLWKVYTVTNKKDWTTISYDTVQEVDPIGEHEIYSGSDNATSPNQLSFEDDYLWYGRVSQQNKKWMRITNTYIYDAETYYLIHGIVEYNYGIESQSMYLYSKVLKYQTVETAGTYQKEVTSSSASAYPTNGKHTDGYWYIKQ